MTTTPTQTPVPLLRVPLDQGWTLTALDSEATIPEAVAGRSFPATVPGCVHTDLLAADAIVDPYLDHNDELQKWIGRTSWRYACTFDWKTGDAEHVDLVCEGLDTVAEVQLNGAVVGQADNMHLGYRFDVAHAVRPGVNELVIDFSAPLPYAEAIEKRMGKMPYVGNGSNPPLPHNMMRKMACNFGWDWGPALVTAGVWRPIYLEAWSGARLDGVRPMVTEARADRAAVEVHLDLGEGSRTDGVEAHITLTDPAGHAVHETSVALGEAAGSPVTLEVTKPKRWWPVGYGDQPLYGLRVELRDAANGTTLQSWSRNIGLRTSRLVTDPDPEPGPLGQGSTFHLEINGQRVYCKGANWIPDDCFPTRVTPQRYRRQIETALAANMNMLRVWGGGIYEDHAFYEACDELGVMVWQDFTLACACYHEQEPFLSWLDAEARYNIARLSSHASLVLWNGCNENVWGVYTWGPDWQAMRRENKPWGLKYYLETFPTALQDLDPTKPYWPASPYAGSPDVFPNVEEHGNCHIWDVWNGTGDARTYLSHFPRFASEFGFHGPPTYPTLDRAIPQDQRFHDSPAMVHHNRHDGGQPLANERMADYFVPPKDFDDWLYLAQVVQARSLALGVEWFRALSPWNSGALYWQFNDCWPVASWSAVDGDQRRKPLWYATRRFLADRLLTIRPTAPVPVGEPFGTMAVYLHNDHAAPWVGELHVARHRVDGRDGQSLLTHRVNIAPRDLLKIDLPHDLDLPPDAFLTATVGNERAFWWPHPDRKVPYPEAQLDAEVSNLGGNRYRVTLEAHTLIRDLCLFADRLDPDAQVSDQLLTLLPGERTSLDISSHSALELEALTTRPVLQCVNRFGL